jgi:hypothetical protein
LARSGSRRKLSSLWMKKTKTQKILTDRKQQIEFVELART